MGYIQYIAAIMWVVENISQLLHELYIAVIMRVVEKISQLLHGL